MKLDVAFTLVLLGMVTTNVKAHATANSETLLEEGVSVFNDIVSNLKSGVDGLKSVKGMTDIAQSVLNLQSQMGSDEKESLKVIVTINKDASLALEASKIVVLKLKNTCDAILPVLNQRKDETQLNLGINTYLGKTGELALAVTTAVEKLIKVSAEAIKVDGAIIKLQNWASAKKAQMVNGESARINAEREKAYASAAACLAAGPFAIFTCPAAYAIAAGITEGKTVKDIENRYDGVIREFDNMRRTIDVIGAKTGSLVDRVKTDKNRMTEIRSQLDNADRNGRLFVKFTNLFFDRFKNSLSDLFGKCQAYLSA